MTWKIMDPSLGYPAIGENVLADASGYVEPVPFGTIVKAFDETYGAGEFIFLKGVASTVFGNAVIYNADDFSTARTGANAIGPVALAMGACVADQAGWYQIGGKGVATVAAGFADNANCYLTGTAGVIDDAVVAGDYIFGMKGASAVGTPSAGLAEVELQRPFVKDGLDDAVT